MCEIQLIKRFDEKVISKSDINDFANLLSLGNQFNKDAHGVFNQSGIIFKSNTEFEFKDTCVNLNKYKSNFLVGHNRFKTKGDAKIIENNHPFETKNFMVVHNGVISNDDTLKDEYGLKYDIQTDSYIIIALLEHFYSLENYNSYTMINLIKKVAEEIYGSYSVVVYSKVTNQLFYFKDKSTRFTFALITKKTGDILLGTTDKENLEITFSSKVRGVFRKLDDYIEYEPEEEYIYTIDDNGLHKELKFEEKTSVTYWSKKDFKSKDSGTYISHTASSSVRTKLKGVANIIQKELEDYYKIKIINRGYDFSNLKVSLETFDDINDSLEKTFADEFCHYGEVSYERQLRDNKVYKTIIILDVDASALDFSGIPTDDTEVVTITGDKFQDKLIAEDLHDSLY